MVSPGSAEPEFARASLVTEYRSVPELLLERVPTLHIDLPEHLAIV